MNPHLLALAVANAPEPATTPLPAMPEPSLTGADWFSPDTTHAQPRPHRAQRRAAARRSKA